MLSASYLYLHTNVHVHTVYMVMHKLGLQHFCSGANIVNTGDGNYNIVENLIHHIPL